MEFAIDDIEILTAQPRIVTLRLMHSDDERFSIDLRIVNPESPERKAQLCQQFVTDVNDCRYLR
jgi:hypothetical protein